MKINTIVDIELNDNPLEWQIQDLEGLILENSREAARQTFLEALVVYEKKSPVATQNPPSVAT